MKAARWSVAGLLLVASLAAAAWAGRLWLSTQLFRQVLLSRGAGSAELQVTGLDATHVHVSGIRVGDPAWLEVARLDVAYRLWPGSAGLQSVEVEGARAAIDLRDTAGEPEPSPAASSGDALALARAWLPARLQLRDAQLQLLTAATALDIGVELDVCAVAGESAWAGSIELTQPGAASGEIRVGAGRLSLPLRIEPQPGRTVVQWGDASLELAGASRGAVALDAATLELPAGQLVLEGDSAAPVVALEAELRAPALQLRSSSPAYSAGLREIRARLDGRLAGGDLLGQLTVGADAVRLPDSGIEIRDAAVELGLPLALHPVRLSHATLLDLLPARRFPRAELSATLTPAGSDAEPRWRLRADARALSGAVHVSAAGELRREGGSLDARLEPLRLRRDGLQPGALIPALAPLESVDGEIAADARIAWSGGELTRSRGSLRISGTSFRVAAVRVENLRAAVELTSLVPLRSAARQELQADALVAAGVRFREPRARFELLPAPPSGIRLRLDEASTRLGDGGLRLSDVVVDSGTDTRELTVHAEHLQLEELLRLLDVEGLSGTGRISGTIPVRLAGSRLEIRDGVLGAEGAGQLRVPSGLPAGVAPSTEEPLVLVRTALADFHYERLGITLSKPLAGSSRLRIDLLGHNPAVLDGQPLDLHIDIETDLEPFLRAASLALQIPAHWQLR